jgi:hypothetical protein
MTLERSEISGERTHLRGAQAGSAGSLFFSAACRKAREVVQISLSRKNVVGKLPTTAGRQQPAACAPRKRETRSLPFSLDYRQLSRDHVVRAVLGESRYVVDMPHIYV